MEVKYCRYKKGGKIWGLKFLFITACGAGRYCRKVPEQCNQCGRPVVEPKKKAAAA